MIIQGDYDGDTMQAFWQPDLVKDFINADIKFLTVPPGAQASTEEITETVEQFKLRMAGKSTDDEVQEIQSYLLAPLKAPSLVGLYSTWWLNSTYKNGYDHEDTQLLASL